MKGMAELAAANNVTISGLNMEMVGDVVDFAGPEIFAKSVVKSIVDEECAKEGGGKMGATRSLNQSSPAMS